jgi:hypothetical protein
MELAAPKGYEGFRQFIVDLQVFKTAIMSYNVNRNKDSFYKNLETLSKNIVEVKVDKRHSRYDPRLIKPLTDLEAFEPLQDKQIIYEDRFLGLTYNIFERIIYNFALSITDIGDYVERLKTSLNRIFVDNYFIIDCDKIRDKVYSYEEDSTLTYYTYNCGRAFMQINENGGKSRFLIFNTNNDAALDRDTLNKYNKTEEEKFIDITFTVKYPVDKKILLEEEFLEFKKQVISFDENAYKILPNVLLSFVKEIKCDIVYKIPLHGTTKYMVKGEFSKDGKHFSIGISENLDSDFDDYKFIIVDLKINGETIVENLATHEIKKVLREKGFIN